MSSLTRSKIFIALFVLFSLSLFLFLMNIHIILSGSIVAVFFLAICVFIHDALQKKHSILINYPLLGRLRFIFESERSKIQQYAIENDINGTPINREKRSDIYQKAKKDSNTVPFGTQLDVYAKGYEFVKHSIFPIDYKTIEEPRFLVGSKFCTQKYSASIFNISAMSFGSLSNAAVLALNGGAKLGNFYHNTGEGGLSPYHLENGGDICWQIGTGYFGSGTTIDGKRYFSDDIFKENALKPQVKMIEIKLSQGAKPGHGGILPAIKNTPEIAKIRNVEPGTNVMSPPYHTAFGNNRELIGFIEKLRNLSGGKPVGFKLCIGNIEEFESLVAAMAEIGNYPDFITVDGGEGGTGAAPLVFTNHVGTPLLDALMAVNSILKKYNLRDDIRVIASGKASTSFDVIKFIAIGADGVNAARAFMLSLGCIQARECNNNTCPVGIATQNKALIRGLDPALKKVRVYNYHSGIIYEIRELMGAIGIDNVKKLSPSMFSIRTSDDIGINTGIKTYNDFVNY